MRTMLQKLVAVCLLCFTFFVVRAADIQVNINDIPAPITVADIKSAIDLGITAAGSSGNVTVIYHNGSNNVPYVNTTATALELYIPSDITVVWSLDYSGTAALASTRALIELTGVGAFTVGSGGSVTASSTGHAITVRSTNFTLNVNSGGTVTSPANNSNSAIQVGINLTGVVINVNGGSVISNSGGYAIEDAPGSGSDSFSNNTSINIGSDAGTLVQAVTSSAIRSRGAGSVVTVSGGTVTNAASNNNNPAINMSGSTINNVIINDGEVSSTSDLGYAIQTTGNILVSGGLITAINGRAINIVGISSVATVSGGIVEATGSGVALSTATTAGVDVTNTVITVTGGTVKANSSNAIHTTGASSNVTVNGGLVYNETTSSAINASVIYAQNGGVVTIASNGFVEARGSGHAIGGGGNSAIQVNGGMVVAKQGNAIRKTSADGTVTVTGGFVFAYGSAFTGSTNTIYIPGGSPVINPSPGDNGVVIAWNQSIAGPNPTYEASSNDHLDTSPASATATWQKSGSDNGIAYTNGANTGFFILDVQIVFPIKPDVNGIVYVDFTKTGNGSSWANAYPNLADPLLQAAIQRSIPGYTGVFITQIWVAEGTYYPLHTADGYDLPGKVFDESDDGSNNAFVLVPEVKIYGGFASPLPTETTPPAFGTTGRNGETILSGDVDDDGTPNDNAYHVIIGVDINVNTNTVIDGFTISGGNANGSTPVTVNGKTINSDMGGGMYYYNASPRLFNVIISNNAATGGGGMFNDNASPALTNAIMRENNASNGGGIYNDGSSPILTNVTMSDNSASGNGGGMMNTNSSSPVVRNTISWENTAAVGRNVHNDVVGTNNPVYSYSLVQRNSGTGSAWDSTLGTDGGNNLACDVDPMFENAATGDYQLKPGSPAIEAGNNDLFLTSFSIPDFTDVTDLAGKQRLMGERIDMGAYETTVYLVTVLSDGTNSSGGGYYGDGEQIDIEAGDPPAGYRFVGWTTTSSVITLNDASNRTTFFTMPAEAVTVTAEFLPVYTVTVVSFGTGASGDGDYLQGEQVNINAGVTPPGYSFLRWITISAGVTFDNDANPATFFMMPANDVIVIAEYDDIYAVVVSSAGTGATGDGYYHEDEVVLIDAGTPPDGMEFAVWTANPEVTFANANNATTTFVMPANTVVVTAEFCTAGDKKAFEDAIHIFETTEWSVCEQNIFTVERLESLLVEQINHLIDSTDITAIYSGITISDIMPPAVNAYGSFDFSVTLTKCAHTQTLNLTCVILYEPYMQIVRLITIDDATNGSIVSDKQYAATRETVTLTILPDAGYQLETITAYHTNYDTIPVLLTGDGAARTFLMPPHVVTVTATFTLATGAHILQGNGLKAYVQDGVLYVSGIAQGGTVRVYNILGELIAHSNSPKGEEFSIPLPRRGIYIITDGNKTIKINN